MDTNDEIFHFAVRWSERFQNSKIDDADLINDEFRFSCEGAGFIMDNGYTFASKYGAAACNVLILQNRIDKVDDIGDLGSGIYSRWSYFYKRKQKMGSEFELGDDNRFWFVVALNRLAELLINVDRRKITEKEYTVFPEIL